MLHKAARAPWTPFSAAGGWRLLASLLCVLALAVNLLGAVAYAESVRAAAAGGLGFIDASICHSGPEAPAGPAAEPRLKCPLCQVSSAGLHVSAKASPPVPVVLSAVPAILPVTVDEAVPPHPLAARPDPRGPPSSV
ncbi:DUF2946 family protein [Magnetospirillum sp. SS-4]|uniref:DUF2946 family protein n=1 Tax=Magnetospirillum sp. SS-4 TaxID=2681465 RepID=UPI00137EB572|nr:DUF2946 family protein [Magnetospirillum sp. SS-4]CAA7626200.1 exported hypothetical protein [Magnetospirillum sp. SS-4]